MAPFTPPSADAVRTRLLDAGREAFAAAGLAATRVERVAAAAGSNKAQVFHYFGSKEGLFDAVVEQAVTELLDAVPIDADELPEWAGRVHDAVLARPWVERLTTWRRLERVGAEPLDAVVERHAASVAAVEHAQRSGRLPRSHRPAVLLGLVVHTAAFWGAMTPEFGAVVSASTPARRRQVVVDAVSALLGRSGT